MGLFERMMEYANRFDQEMKTTGEAAHKSESQASSSSSITDVPPALRSASTTISPAEHELSRELAHFAQDRLPCVRYYLVFSGEVQGVGFRWNNQGLANEHHLTGWVRNLSNGSVEMEIQGTPASVSEHLARVHAYYQRFRNQVVLDSYNQRAPIEGEKSFSVRY